MIIYDASTACAVSAYISIDSVAGTTIVQKTHVA